MIWIILLSLLFLLQILVLLDLTILGVIVSKREFWISMIPFYWTYVWLKKAYNTYKNLP